MKYSVEITEKGYVEKLEVYGKEYKKDWKVIRNGNEQCEDMDFSEQLTDDGITDEDLLDEIRERIDFGFFASDFRDIYEQLN